MFNIKYSTSLVDEADPMKDKATGVRVALINQANEMFFLYNKKWQSTIFPGGWIDEGETPQQAAQRELKEELGIDVKIKALKIAAYIDVEDIPRQFSGVVAILIARQWTGEIINCEPEKHNNLHWFGGIDFSEMDPGIRPICCRLKMIKKITPIQYRIIINQTSM